MKKQPARKTAKITKAKDGAAPKKQQITTEDRHRAFAREYVALAFNATQAAIAAGYSAATAASQGARLLRDTKVQAYVKEFSQAAVERAEVKAEDVVRRLHDMLMADPRELVEVYVSSCRHCHGVAHEYQYTLAEYNAKREKWLDAMRLASVFEEELLQDLDGGERNKLGEVLTRLLRRVEDAQPDAEGRLADLD